MSNSLDTTHDIIISGGGMVGLALAIAAAKNNLSVALIEQSHWQPHQAEDGQYSPRVSAINPASERLLTHLGAWQRIPEQRKAYYTGMDVWDGLGQGAIQFNASDVQRSQLGCIVENNQISESLWQQVFEFSQIEVLSGEKIAHWQQDQQCVEVQTSSKQTFIGKVLVAAEGKHSAIREQSNISSWRWSYQHQAIVTTVQHTMSHQQIARQVFLESGPLAFLPLPDDSAGNHYSSIVWSTKTARAEQLSELTDEEFVRELNQAFEHRLGEITHVDPRFSFELTAAQAKQYFDNRIVVLGDAAHAIHPLAGLGVNVGFLDVAELAQQWQQAQTKGLDIGHEFVMRRFQRQRQSHNYAVAGLMEGLKRLYDTTQPLPVIARNLGLGFINQQLLLKRPLVLAALGDTGAHVPDYCRAQ